MAQACKVRQFRYLVGLDKEPESVKMKIVFLLAVLFTTASGQRDVNHRWQGHGYHLSWLSNRRGDFTWFQAERYCSRRNMKMISLDDVAKREHFLGLLEEQGSPDYFWTGGMLEFAGRNRFQRELKIVWPNRKEEPVRRGHPWSLEGLNGSQPDGNGGEKCIAVIDIPFYGDGPKFHDVTCSHKKPIICE